MKTRTYLVLAAGLATSSTALAQTYSITALTPTGSGSSFGFGVNDSGDVCGQGTGPNMSALWQVGQPLQNIGIQNGIAMDINNADQVVGGYYGAAGFIPYFWEVGTAAPLPLASGWTYSDPRQINDAGTIVGVAYNTGTVNFLGDACVWVRTGQTWAVTALPSLASPNAGGGAFGINDAGAIVGTSKDASGVFRAAKWESGSVSVLPAPAPHTSAVAMSINRAGRYVGYTVDAGVAAAFRCDGVTAVPAGGVPGFAHTAAVRLNDADTAVGWAWNGAVATIWNTVNDCRALVWRGTTPVVINSLIHSAPAQNFDIRQAWDINNQGQITGIACVNGTGPSCAGGVWRSVLLTPCYANCDDSLIAPVLNVNDFICFQQKFAAGDTYANCDNSTTAPVLNINDFICFQQKFAAGCS